jgi:F-type H+-transporting ATPase subunit alpha
VGGDAQTKAIKQVAGRLRLDMAAYREVAAFAQFGSDLDKTTQAQLARGQRMQEILKQPQYQPYELEEEVVVLFAATRGYADDIHVDRIVEWERSLLRSIEASHPEILKDIASKQVITEGTESELSKAIETFNRSWAE